MSFCDEHGTADYCGECVYGPEIERLTAERDAAQAEARNWKRIAEDATHVEREELTRVREIVSGMREYADSCDHPSEASKRNAVEYWLAQLEDALSQAAERESLPLMARREWMLKGAQYAYRDRDSAWFQSVDKPGRAWEFCYRIADTDEHGLPVIPREPGMREGARYRGWTENTQRWSYYTRYIKRHAHDRFERIEDYVSAAQESGDA